MNGSRGRSNNFLLDGTDMNDGYRNDPAINEAGVFGDPATILPIDAVAELRVLSNYEAEYGRNSGAVVNIVTKSGTNNWHGSALEYFRSGQLGARNYFNFASGSEEPVQQQPIRRLAGRADRERQDILLRRIMKDSAKVERRQAELRSRSGGDCRRQASILAVRRNPESGHGRSAGHAIPGLRRISRDAVSDWNGLHRQQRFHLDQLLQPRRQLDWQDRSQFQSQQHADRALLLRRQRRRAFPSPNWRAVFCRDSTRSLRRGCNWFRFPT